MRRPLIALAAVVLVGAVVAGLLQAGGSSEHPHGPRAPSLGQATAALRGSPPPLDALHRQASLLLPGGAGAFKARLRALAGHPVVVNKWASWCSPCRTEFPYLQRASVELGRTVAFVGVDSSDNDADARTFLTQYPVSYPSFRDPDLSVANVFSGAEAFPTTAFYDARGKLEYIHQGEYMSEGKLIADVRRYAIGGGA